MVRPELKTLIPHCKLTTIVNGKIYDNRKDICDPDNCPKCGWNVEVESARIKEGREKLGIK